MNETKRLSDNKINGIQFGNFKYIFEQQPATMWNNKSYINTIHIITCDNIKVIKLIFDYKTAQTLYNYFLNMIKDKDSFYEKIIISTYTENTSIYGYYDFYTEQYKLCIEVEQLYNIKNKSIITISMNEEDFKEFVFLFYFNFLIAIIG